MTTIILYSWDLNCLRIRNQKGKRIESFSIPLRLIVRSRRRDVVHRMVADLASQNHTNEFQFHYLAKGEGWDFPETTVTASAAV